MAVTVTVDVGLGVGVWVTVKKLCRSPSNWVTGWHHQDVLEPCNGKCSGVEPSALDTQWSVCKSPSNWVTGWHHQDVLESCYHRRMAVEIEIVLELL